MTEPLFLLDAYGIIYQSYFAFIKRPLYNPQGKNSQAVFGFFRTLFELLKTYKPSFLAVIMDSKTKTFRHNLFSAYKAHREATPLELHEQITIIEEILTALGIKWLRLDGFEADDILATLAYQAKLNKHFCFLISRDKDILQLVEESVYVLRQQPSQKGFESWNAEAVYKNLKVYPSQIVDYLALIGDQSDNIPGVKGIGPKTAVKLLAEYKNLEGIYQNLDKVAPSQAALLLAGKDDALLSQQLLKLKTDLPLKLNTDDYYLERLNIERALPLFQREGMKTLAKELESQNLKKTIVKETLHTFSKYQAVLSETELSSIINKIEKAKVFALDTETDSLNEQSSKLLGISLAWQAYEAVYIPLEALNTNCLPKEIIFQHLQNILKQPDILLIGQNVKYDYKVLVRCGLEIKNKLFDTMVAAWLLDTGGTGSYSLDRLAEKYLNYKTIQYNEVIPEGSNLTLAQLPLDKVVAYSAEDADVAFRLYQSFSLLLKNENLDKLFYELEMPVLKILSQMELAGIRVLPEVLGQVSTQVSEALKEQENKIFKLAGHSFNINSPKQLQDVLFTERGLKPLKKIKTGFSTDNQVLELLAQEDELPALILEYRALAKLQNTYLEVLPTQINPQTQRLHTVFLQTGTATGRLSSKEPNLQNIPVRSEWGKLIRQAFVPEAGKFFLSADYSQIELAVLAHLSQDELLCQAFCTSVDVHALTASLIFHKPIENISPEERRLGKTINFGVIYGMSPFRLAQDFKISKKESAAFIDEYFKRYQGVKKFKDSTIAQAEKNGFVTTLLGRKRLLPTIISENKTEKAQAERIAFNSTIQGSAADIVKLAMLKVSDYISQHQIKARLLLQVHDELILEIDELELKPIAKALSKIMENAYPLKIPLRVKLGWGENWGEMKEIV